MGDEDYADIEKTSLTLTLGASLSVTTTASGLSDWIKPEASFSTTWKGVPTDEQVRTAATFIRDAVLDPLLDEVIVAAQNRLTEARRGQ
jgi:hypothetical protein